MSSFINQIISRHIENNPVVLPRLPGRFESYPGWNSENEAEIFTEKQNPRSFENEIDSGIPPFEDNLETKNKIHSESAQKQSDNTSLRNKKEDKILPRSNDLSDTEDEFNDEFLTSDTLNVEDKNISEIQTHFDKVVEDNSYAPDTKIISHLVKVTEGDRKEINRENETSESGQSTSFRNTELRVNVNANPPFGTTNHFINSLKPGLPEMPANETRSVVKVTISRIDVRAVQSPPDNRKSNTPPPSSKTSLEDYLKNRKRSG